VNSKRPRR